MRTGIQFTARVLAQDVQGLKPDPQYCKREGEGEKEVGEISEDSVFS